MVPTHTSNLEEVRWMPRYVRFGSKADMCTAIGHVRFTPKSGHVRVQLGMSALGQ
jgi:hypothetical protein